MKLEGIHHVSAISANIAANHDFFTRILGMRLVKKSVNQDNPSSYHLFYADTIGTPGTDMTYFNIPMARRTYPGVSSISNTAFRLKSDEALTYWMDRLDALNVPRGEVIDRFGRKTMTFQDFEGSRLMFVVDDGTGIEYGIPWTRMGIPEEFAIVGLGPVRLTVRTSSKTVAVLTEVMGFEQLGEYPSTVEGQKDILVFSTGKGGPAGEIHLEERSDLPPERPGRGSVHHVAFRVKTYEDYHKWNEHLRSNGLVTSGEVDRHYFKAIYFREPNGILFELSTDEPGFSTDESIEKLGEKLALPPFLEAQRDEIEASLSPLELTSEEGENER